jgi:hypothetical protein
MNSNTSFTKSKKWYFSILHSLDREFKGLYERISTMNIACLLMEIWRV